MQKNRLKRPVVFFLCLGFPVLSCLIADDFFKVKERIVKEAWKNIAFFYVAPTLTLENVGHDSNIYSYQGLEEPDWTADLGLNVNVSSILGNRFILSIDENPYYLFYARHKNFRAFNNRLTTTLYTYVGRLNLKYRYNIDKIRQRPSSEFGTPVWRRITGHEVSLDYGRHKRFFVNLYWRQSKSGYDDENYLGNYNLKRLLDQEITAAGIKLNKTIFSRTNVVLNFEYFEQRFDFETNRDGIGKRVSLGVQFPEIGRIKGSLEFGLKAFDPANPLYKKFTLPFGTGRVSIELLRKFRFHLQYLIDNFYTFWQEDQQYNEKSLGGGVEYYLSKKLKVGYTYRFGRLAYENLTDREKTRQDDFYMSSVSFGIRIFKNTGIGLEYRMFRSNSTEPDLDRSNNFIGGYVTHEF